MVSQWCVDAAGVLAILNFFELGAYLKDQAIPTIA